MGKYTSAVDIRKLFKEVETGDVTDEDLEFYIRMAEAEVDGCIARRYTLPFSLTPHLVRDIAVELSLIKVLDRFFTGQAQDENEQRNVRKKEVDRLLSGVCSGTISLVDSAGALIAERNDVTGISSDTSQYTPVFGHGDAIGEEVDPDKLEDERDDRN